MSRILPSEIHPCSNNGSGPQPDNPTTGNNQTPKTPEDKGTKTQKVD